MGTGEKQASIPPPLCIGLGAALTGSKGFAVSWVRENQGQFYLWPTAPSNVLVVIIKAVVQLFAARGVLKRSPRRARRQVLVEMKPAVPTGIQAARSRSRWVKGGDKATRNYLQLGCLPRKGQPAEGFKTATSSELD